MCTGHKEFLEKIQKEKPYFKDLHIIRFYSSYVAISNGKVVALTTPYMRYCPLAEALYGNMGRSSDHDEMKKTIINTVDKKIQRFSHFTSDRELIRNDISVPYGASEMLMYAMRKKVIDAAVVVCEGAGTVIVNRPEVVQGIGARMSGVFFTTPIRKIINKLEKYGCHVVFSQAGINQVEGVRKAVSLGYKRIAVTINASMDESFSELMQIENSHNISLACLAVCTTGINKARVQELSEYADLIWSCASSEVRKSIGKKSILQLSVKIPVFSLTLKGVELISAYSPYPNNLLNNIDPLKQYLVNSIPIGKEIKLGNFRAYLKEARLPVRDAKEPGIIDQEIKINYAD
jgi:putative methanogenesis marker protein 8